MLQIECRDVALGYDGKIFAEGLNFGVESGDYLCIVGENGAGKSTLIKTVLGLRTPVRGEITLKNGTKMTDIGYLPQQTAVQRDFPASVREIVTSGCLNRCGMRPFYRRAEKKAAAENMKRLGIDMLSGRCYRELSGGQQQRTLLARALCAAQKILLLDEPAAALDPIATQEMYELIYDLNKTEGLTVVMVSHDIKAAVRYAKHILHVGGERSFFGTAADYAVSDMGKGFFRHSGGDGK